MANPERKGWKTSTKLMTAFMVAGAIAQSINPEVFSMVVCGAWGLVGIGALVVARKLSRPPEE